MKKHVLLAATFLLSLSAFAGDLFHFSVAPGFGVLNGQIDEYVLAKSSYVEGNKLSELNWEIKNIPYASIKADFWLWETLAVGGQGRYAIPLKSGKMYDRDWRNISTPENYFLFVDFSNDSLTNYSESDNYMNEHWEYSGYLALKTPIINSTNLAFKIQAQYSYYSFTARGGNANYGNKFGLSAYYPVGYVDEDGDPQFTEFSLGKNDVISYEQERIFSWLGVELDTKVIPFTWLRLAAYTAPFIKISGLDTHHLTDMRYLDRTKGQGGLKAEAELSLRFTKHFEIGAMGTYMSIPLTSGETYQKNIISVSKMLLDPNYLGGTSSTLWDATLNATIRW